MQIQLLKVTAFGFIIELTNDTAYYAPAPYEIYLNGEFYAADTRNIVALFGLQPDTEYLVECKACGSEAQPVNTTVRTLLPSFVVNVRDYACPNTAIYTAPAGSVVVFPQGEYIIGSVLLKSGVDLYLEEGAVLRQSVQRERIPILKGYQKNYDHSDVTINASWEGHPLDSYAPVVYGKDVQNVHIYGGGIIDGSGAEGGFWENPKQKKTAWRPKNIFLVNCKNIEVSGITTRNSASWNVHPFYCENVTFRAMKIESIEESPNTDGINPESCTDVDIVGCHFSVGDDCIAIKAGKYFMAVRHPAATRNVHIRQCYMEKGHGGVVLGSEMSCGIYNVRVEHTLLIGTDRGLRIKTRRGRGAAAIVDGVHFYNVRMQGVKHPFVINMFYNCDPDGKSDFVRNKSLRKRDNMTPSVGNVNLADVYATGITGTAVFIYGLPESRVTGVGVKDCTFAFADDRVLECPAMMDDFTPVENLGIYIANADEITMIHNKFEGACVEICE
jgi:polygalacturonase